MHRSRLNKGMLRQRRALFTAAIVAASQLPVDTFADRTWDSTIANGNWTTPANWVGNVAPLNTDNIVITFNDFSNHTVTYNGTLSSNLSVSIRNTGSGSATLLLPAGFALTCRFLNLGPTGSGKVTQTAGSLTAASVDLAGGAASAALYTLSGGTLSVTGTGGGNPNLFVGDLGSGTFTQSGGLASLASQLILGNTATGTGNYNLSSAGLLTVTGNETIGLAGKGTFTQTGGTNTATSALILGANTGAIGVYTINDPAALLSVNGSAYIGGTSASPGGAGILNIQAGTMHTSNTLKIWNTTNSAINLSGGLLSVGTLDTSSNPSFFTSGWTGGTLNITGSMGGSGGVFNFGLSTESGSPLGNNFTLSAGKTLIIKTWDECVGNTTNGTFTQTGGNHIVALNDLVLGNSAGVIGIYSLSGSGTLTVTNDEFVGSSGFGSFYQTGGSHTVGGLANRQLLLGTASGSTGSYTLNGATALLTVNGFAFIGGLSGVGGGNGILNIQAGTMNVVNTLKIWDTGTSAVNLSGGLLSVGTLDTSGSPSRFLNGWTGGTLVVTNNDGNGFSINSTGPLGNNLSLSGTMALILLNNYETIGGTTNGTLTQTGGSHTIAHNGLLLGSNGGTAVYNLSGSGSLSVSNGENLGDNNCYCLFNQTGGTNASSDMYMASLDGSISIYNLGASGTLMINNVEGVGALGIGTFNQTGGANSTSFLILPVGQGTGVYNLGGTGILTANVERLGLQGYGTFNQTAGTNTVYHDLQLGITAVGSGHYTLNGPSALFAVNGSVYVGGSDTAPGGLGVINVQAGAMTVVNTLKIWDTLNTAVNLSGGSLSVNALDTSGFPYHFNWTGGTFNITGPNGLSISSAGPLGATLVLSPPMTLGVTNTLNIPAGSDLELNGGSLNFGSLAFSGGTIGGTGSFINNTLLSGNGFIATANVTNNSQLTQSGGDLTLSSSTSLTNAGTMTLAPGLQLQLTGATLANHGVIYLNSANINGSAQVNNFSDALLSGPGNINVAFTNAGTLLVPDGITKVGSFTNTGVIELAANAATLASPGTITNSATIQGHGKISAPITNNATIEALTGTLVLTGPVTNSGILRSGPSTKILFQGASNFSTNAGLISLIGGTVDTGGQPLNNTGQISGFGVLATGGLTNNNIMTLTGGTTTINGPVTNASGKTLLIKNDPALFTGPVTNNGTIKTTNTIVTFTSNYTGNAYISDPSTNIFSANVTIIPGGSMTGALGDQFILTGGNSSLFTNNGTFTNGGYLSSSISALNTGNFTQTGAQAWSPNTTFTNSGAATFSSDAGSSSAYNLNLHLSGGTVTLNSAQHLASLAFDPQNASFTGTIDLKNNYLLLGPGNSSNTLRTYLLSGSTNGTGLKSSTLAANQALGYMDANIYNLLYPNHQFQGNTLAGNELLAKTTWQGDADLNGYITINDYAQLEAGFLFGHFNATTTFASWVNGDFNYDGKINYLDYALIDNAFQNQSGTLASDQIESHTLEFGTPYLQALSSLSTPAPEPTSLSLLSLATPLLLRRPRTTR